MNSSSQRSLPDAIVGADAKIMVNYGYLWEMIPIAGRKIQVSEILFHLPR